MTIIIKNQGIIALCGSLASGVSVPVIIAAQGNTTALLTGIVMLVASVALIGFSYTANTFVIKFLLGIHILLAFFILLASGFIYFQTRVSGAFFLILWSVTVIISALTGWRGIKSHRSN
jgi:hypothetical protein